MESSIESQQIVEQSKQIGVQPQEITKQKVILGLDPGFIKMGLAVINLESGQFIESRCVQLKCQAKEKKQTQTQVEAQVCNNLNNLFTELYNLYDIAYCCIELQMGNFSCTNIQSLLVAYLHPDTKFVVQHSKLKLKHPEMKEIEILNIESKQYNQNKMSGRSLVQKIYKEQQFTENNYDQCDALLHALYGYRNMKSISWVSKSTYV